MAAVLRNAPRKLTGVVVSAGKMTKCVKVEVAGREWNAHIRKYYPSSTTYLTSDPTATCRTGDVVTITSGWRTSRHVRHVVDAIVAPFGAPLADRPPLLTEAERLARRERDRLAKDVRQALRGRPPAAHRVREAVKAGRLGRRREGESHRQFLERVLAEGLPEWKAQEPPQEQEQPVEQQKGEEVRTTPVVDGAEEGALASS